MTEQSEQADLHDADRGANVHDMGGAIGPASVRGSGAKDQGGAADDAAPHDGYAQDVGAVAGPDQDQPTIAGGDDSPADELTAPTVVSGAPSLYVDMDADEAGQAGRGADGDTDARRAQKQAGEF